MIIFASDLDNTLIHSYKKADKNDICVEEMNGKQLSFMTQKGYKFLQEVAQKYIFVPVTTRSIEQYKRISLLENSFPKYALVSNGGILLVDNEVDESWLNESKQMFSHLLTEIEEYISILRCDPNVYFDVRFVDDIFIFTKSSNTEATIDLLEKYVDKNNFTIYSIKEKVYIIPNVINKGTAIEKLCKLLGADSYICAGDSVLDLPMLLTASKAFVPKGYLHNNDNFIVSESDSFCDFISDSIAL